MVALFALVGATFADGAAPAWQNDLNAARLLALTAGDPPPPTLAQAFAELAAKYPRQLEVQRACGDQAWGAGDVEEAVRYWEAAQKIAPGDIGAAVGLAGAFLKLGRIRPAVAQYELAAARAPDDALRHFELANVLSVFRHEIGDNPTADHGEGSLRRALAEYRRAAELAASDRRLAQAYADTYYLLAQPDWEAALTAWKTVRDLSGDATDFANIHLARISLKRGRPADARGYLDLLKAASPAADRLRELANRAQRNSSASPSR